VDRWLFFLLLLQRFSVLYALSIQLLHALTIQRVAFRWYMLWPFSVLHALTIQRVACFDHLACCMLWPFSCATHRLNGLSADLRQGSIYPLAQTQSCDSKCSHMSTKNALMHRVGQNHIYVYGVYTVLLAWKSPNIRCIYTYIYGSGQPYLCTKLCHPSCEWPYSRRMQGWPEPCIYTMYDRIFGDFAAKYIVHTPYVSGSGQP
jgi:hypothetical protein